MNVPRLRLTPQLLLQLDKLKQECTKTWDEITTLFREVCDIPSSFINTTLQDEIARVKRNIHTQTSIKNFLDTDLHNDLSNRNLGDFLRKLGVQRQDLLTNGGLAKLAPCPPALCINSVIVELLIFQKLENVRDTDLRREWWKYIGLDVTNLSESQLSKKLKKLKTPYDSAMKHKERENGRDKLFKYMTERPTLFTLTFNNEVREDNVQPQDKLNCQEVHHIDTVKLNQARQLAAMRRQVSELEAEKAMINEERQCLIDIQRESSQEISSLLATNDEKEKRSHDLQQTVENLQMENDLQSHKLMQQSQTNYYRRLKRWEGKLKEKEEIITKHNSGGCEETLRDVKKKLKHSQTDLSHIRGEKRQLKQELKDMKDRVNAAEIEERVAEDNTIETRLKNRKFAPGVVKTVISLISHGVSGANCAKVIQTVATNLFGQELELSDLPSERTSLRFADQGHVLGKAQVAEAMMNDTYDLHSDGTTKHNFKTVGHQITTGTGGSLSCGFEEVATEDAKTLVDISVRLLQECAEIFDDQERDHFFRVALGNLKGLMSDRASVNKAAKRDLNDLRKATIGTGDDLEFLFCNAHFLLGLGKLS